MVSDGWWVCTVGRLVEWQVWQTCGRGVRTAGRLVKGGYEQPVDLVDRWKCTAVRLDDGFVQPVDFIEMYDR